MSGDRAALWGRHGECAHLCTTWECRCLRKHRAGEGAKAGSVTKQYLFPHGARVQEECLQGLLAPQPFSDQMGALFTHANLQGLAEVLTLWPEMGSSWTISPHSLNFFVVNPKICICFWLNHFSGSSVYLCTNFWCFSQVVKEFQLLVERNKPKSQWTCQGESRTNIL